MESVDRIIIENGIVANTLDLIWFPDFRDKRKWLNYIFIIAGFVGIIFLILLIEKIFE